MELLVFIMIATHRAVDTSILMILSRLRLAVLVQQMTQMDQMVQMAQMAQMAKMTKKMTKINVRMI